MLIQIDAARLCRSYHYNCAELHEILSSQNYLSVVSANITHRFATNQTF